MHLELSKFKDAAHVAGTIYLQNRMHVPVKTKTFPANDCNSDHNTVIKFALYHKKKCSDLKKVTRYGSNVQQRSTEKKAIHCENKEPVLFIREQYNDDFDGGINQQWETFK